MKKSEKYGNKIINVIVVAIILIAALYLIGVRIDFKPNIKLFNNIVRFLNSIPVMVQIAVGVVVAYFIIKIINKIFNYLITNNWRGKLKIWFKSRIYKSMHFISLTILSIYVMLNWKTCIHMQFFDEFDGNNILFLVWIVLIFLSIYDVDSKALKVHLRKEEQKRESVNDLSLKYALEMKKHELIMNQSKANKTVPEVENDEQ